MEIIILKSLLFPDMYECACVPMHWCMCVTVHDYRSEDDLQGSVLPSAMLALGIELRLSSLVTKAFTPAPHHLSSHNFHFQSNYHMWLTLE